MEINGHKKTAAKIDVNAQYLSCCGSCIFKYSQTIFLLTIIKHINYYYIKFEELDVGKK